MRLYKIGFDFDGVIANTDIIKKQWFEKKGILIENCNKSDVYSQLKKQYQIDEIDNLYKAMSNEVFTQESLNQVIPNSNAIESIKKLSNDFEIYIITSRSNEQVLHVKKWLKKFEIHNYIKKIISASKERKEKLRICIENNIILFCDDDIRHLIYEEGYRGIKLLFNGKIKDEKKTMQVKNWKEIINYIYNTLEI